MNRELMEKARQAKSPEELLALARENDIQIPEERAKALFETLSSSAELADEELDNVAGGCRTETRNCPHCGSDNTFPIPDDWGGGRHCNSCGEDFD